MGEAHSTHGELRSEQMFEACMCFVYSYAWFSNVLFSALPHVAHI